jgi:hypothetical protein
MEFTILPNDGAKNALKTIGLADAKSSRAVRQMWFNLMKDINRSTRKEILYGHKSGELYRFKGKLHRSSSPGETHANLTGKARKSLSWKVYGSHSADFGYGVSVTGRNAAPPYVDALEYGRLDGTMAPRPTLQNELDHIDSKAQKYFSKALKDQGL